MPSRVYAGPAVPEPPPLALMGHGMPFEKEPPPQLAAAACCVSSALQRPSPLIASTDAIGAGVHLVLSHELARAEVCHTDAADQ